MLTPLGLVWLCESRALRPRSDLRLFGQILRPSSLEQDRVVVGLLYPALARPSIL